MRDCWVAALVASSLAAGVVPACAINLSPAQAQLYSSVEVRPPTARDMVACYGFVCRRRLVIEFTAAERTALMSILAKGRASPAEERKAIQQAFIWFDRRMARDTGTDRRVAHADFRMLDDDHNFDCWDTTRNAQSLLLVLQEWGALRHHVVSEPRYRGNVFFGQTPHNTATIKEKVGGVSWVVDMWTTAFGQVPDVMTVEKWMTER
jgi:hypothetical protein